MSPRSPDHRARAILLEVASGDDTKSNDVVERDFFHYVKHGEASNIEVVTAFELGSDDEYKHVMNALIIGGVDEAYVCDGLRLSPMAFQAYTHLFCDVGVFPHVLAIARYIKRLDVSEEVRELYGRAVERGPKTVVDTFRVGERPRLDPDEVLDTVLGDMYSRFLSHRGKMITDEITKEALKWCQPVISLARALSDKNIDAKQRAAMGDDIKIALEIRDNTRSLADLGLKPEDILAGE